MPRSLKALLVFCITFCCLRAAPLLPSNLGAARQVQSAFQQATDSKVFNEFGFVSSETADYRKPGAKYTLTAYQMRDATGALAAWDWLRPPDSHRCGLADRCAAASARTLVLDANYVLDFRGSVPTKSDLEALAASLPKRHPSDLPPVVNFVPLKDLVPNSARYILGPESLKAVAPELAAANPGFGEGAEAHYTAYRVDGGVVRLVLFDYPSPEMARLHTVDFKLVPGAQVKRSGVLVAVIAPGVSEKQGQAVLDQVKYQAKILWNEPPPPSPVPSLFRLLVNIIILSAALSALALAAGIAYGLMRLFRRRYGSLEQDEAMTTLHLAGD